MKKINILLTGAMTILAFASCDKFLDVMPDNRATIDSEAKVQQLLTSAYLSHESVILCEYSSDNVDEHNNPNSIRFLDQIYKWEDLTETANEGPENIWEDNYACIAAANHALEALENIAEENDGEWTSTMLQAKAEALLCRAYSHFNLVNIFCLNYNSKTSATDLGITYMEAPETQLDPDYDRGNVADVYAKIDRDLQEALPLVGDSYYTVPKYHFNPKAAYAFAARFYLYYEKWAECIKYADLCLGASPKSMLRNWKDMASMTQSFDAIANEYINANANANLLLHTAYSRAGVAFGPYTTWKRYSHGSYLASHETGNAENVWGRQGYYMVMHSYPGSTYEFTIFWKLPYLFEYTDAVAGIGYTHTVLPAFTADECLLNRAEAKIMLGQNDDAAADMDMWVKNIVKTPSYDLTVERIKSFYNSQKYSYEDENGWEGTVKKHLNPAFKIDAEGSTQECMLQCVIGLRRIETLQTGLRWFDIKRYGIEIIRRTVDGSGQPSKVTDKLTVNDPRRAMQIPSKCQDAGVKPNPR